AIFARMNDTRAAVRGLESECQSIARVVVGMKASCEQRSHGCRALCAQQMHRLLVSKPSASKQRVRRVLRRGIAFAKCRCDAALSEGSIATRKRIRGTGRQIEISGRHKHDFDVATGKLEYAAQARNPRANDQNHG